MPKKKVIHDPHLDQYLFDLLYSSTREQRSRFPAKYQHIFNSSKAAQSFCVTSTLEEKEYVLSLLGIRWFKIYSLDQFTPKDFRELLSMYKEFGQSGILKEAVKKNIYVYSDKQIMTLLNIISNTEQHPSYVFDLDVKKVGYHLRKWTKKITNSTYNQAKDSTTDFNIIARTVNNTQRAFSRADTLFDTKQNDLMILFFLYENRFSYVSHMDLYKQFDGVIFKAKVTQAVRRLMYLRFLEQNYIAKSKEYTITGLGIEKVNTFVKYVLKANNFQ